MGAFTSKDATASSIFDLVDIDKEVHPVFNDLLLRALVYLTSPHSPARSSDPEPLVAQFSECLKAIEASGAGALEDKHAKRQLLSSLDADFYREVITPLRLDTEVDKVSIEEIYAHVCEVWWCANPNGLKNSFNPATPLSVAYTSGSEASEGEEVGEVVGEMVGEVIGEEEEEEEEEGGGGGGDWSKYPVGKAASVGSLHQAENRDCPSRPEWQRPTRKANWGIREKEGTEGEGDGQQEAAEAAGAMAEGGLTEAAEAAGAMAVAGAIAVEDSEGHNYKGKSSSHQYHYLPIGQ
ncbi:hypothetical protein CYMTET_3448 [Cymbomonas tetramitiformis]|uniref:Uncharacterized protein n=1 Tax=Cymbomonas tetramitiformis TaxID=36881 RepID=A0AAE0H3A0_9CHLO|nr:hypothetical protein CYMTET_3448 [Cymbomonas tetramitiformis]